MESRIEETRLKIITYRGLVTIFVVGHELRSIVSLMEPSHRIKACTEENTQLVDHIEKYKIKET